MEKTVVMNVVGLTPELLGEHTPFLSEWAERGQQATVEPSLPAVTCSVQSTFLTGTPPSEHGIVGNGWYFRDTAEIRFWLRSGRLIQRPYLWETARQMDPDFTVANLYWRYAAYSGADHVVIERPMYAADGRKIPDLYTTPSDFRFERQDELGQFPLFNFWGPTSSIESSQWVADSAKMTERRFDPTLTLLYLPHLDYNLQRIGPRDPDLAQDLREIDEVCKDLITFYEDRGAQVVLLSEYGIREADRPVALNRMLRREGYVTVREEMGGELLVPGASAAFAVADHPVAHIDVRDEDDIDDVRDLVASTDGVEQVLDTNTKADYDLDHPNSGELIAISERDAWFSYYYWLDDDMAPDFAPTVEIHRKPGYDPAELFLDPDLTAPQLRATARLLQKKLGFRYVMDVIPTNGRLVKGSHGRLPDSTDEGPLLISNQSSGLSTDALHATDVHDVILSHLTGESMEQVKSASRD